MLDQRVILDITKNIKQIIKSISQNMRTHCFLATQMRGQQQLTTSYMHRFQIEPAKLANLYVCPCTQMDFLIVVQFLTTLTKYKRCDLKFHSFLYSRKWNINQLILIWSYSTELCVYSLKICTLLNTVKHSQIFRAEFHNSQGKSISVSSNTIYQSYWFKPMPSFTVAQTKSYYTICNLSFSIGSLSFIFHISFVTK